MFMKIAVIATGGKQYLVKDGSVITVEKLPGDLKEGDSVTFDKVLLTDDGSAVTVGAPNVSGASIKASVVSVGKGKKVQVVRYKAKSRYLKRRGHRQPFTKVKVSF
jgi:large subunit ribosomal protein L21